MANSLKLYKNINGEKTPFPSEDEQVIVSSFRYDAKRMGGAPTISCTINHGTCLDNLWSRDVYVEFRGEKYYLKQTPTSSHDNTDVRYKHDAEFVSERIILDNVYFYDVVTNDASVDKVVSNSTSFTFSGDIHEFAKRLNMSLAKLNVGYVVDVDAGVKSDVELVTFENQFITNVLQTMYDVYKIPYYFVGKVIRIGEYQDTINKVFKYGSNESLLSITKNNANSKTINRITGQGSSDNIPYYYPNDDAKGLTSVLYNGRIGIASIINQSRYRKVKLSDKFVYASNAQTRVSLLNESNYHFGSARIKQQEQEDGKPEIDKGYLYSVEFYYTIVLNGGENVAFNVSSQHVTKSLKFEIYKISSVPGVHYGTYKDSVELSLTGGTYNFIVKWEFYSDVVFEFDNDIHKFVEENLVVSADIVVDSTDTWTYNGIPVNLESYGLYSPNAYDGDTISFKLDKYIHPQPKLMPSIYRNSEGEDRFYNAINDTYEKQDGEGYYEFDNLYSQTHPKEHIENFDNIKPTIKNVQNAQGEYIDSFIDFAYDELDNDEVDENNEFIHPYFYAKLKKFDGDYGFNLFDHAIESNEMVVAMVDGSCASCEFTIMVDSKTQKNKVLVDSNGKLLRDSQGNVRFGTPQDEQNDTINNEVWIALKKNLDTYGVIMPNASNKYRPSNVDKFVLLHIDLPKVYVEAAENKLEKELIKFMYENNSEKFSFSISFSRIFFQENPDVLSSLTENSKVKIEYNGQEYNLYVSSMSYNVDANAILPDIRVELADVLSISQNQIQQIVLATEKKLLEKIGEAPQKRSVVETTEPSYTGSLLDDDNFLRKDQNDRSSGLISSDVGFEVGKFVAGMVGGYGAKMYIDENQKTVLEVDKIHGREELIVPTITFNCIDVVSGDKAQTFAYGTIKSVAPNNDGTGVATLDLLDGEYGTLHEYDILRGVFHNIEGGNANSVQEDANGFYSYAGFSTSYFTPINITKSEAGSMEFVYALQEGTDIHPAAGMNFFAYGNFQNEDRRSITYENRLYTRRLCGVDTWKIDPSTHVKYQDGSLDGLSVDGMEMEGFGTFGENFYLTGSTIKYDKQQKEELKGESAYSAILSEYVGSVRINSKGEIEREPYREANVSSGDGNVVADGANVRVGDYILQTRIQAYKGGEELAYSTVVAKGFYIASISAVGCEAHLDNGVIFIDSVDDISLCYVSVYVNCEGNASFEMSYQIKAQKDGQMSFKNMVFARSNGEPSKPVGGSFEFPEPNNINGVKVWFDGVPDGEAQLWISSRVFTSDEKEPQQDEWSNPSPLTDTSDFEVIYSPLKEHKDIPSGFKKNGVEIDDEWLAIANTNGWYDDATEESVWMATNTCHNGAWQGWKIAKIKGEKGEDGEGALAISVSASAVSRNSLGHYEPSSVLVNAYRGKKTEEVFLTIYGQKEDGGYVAISAKDWHEERGSFWNIDLSKISAADYKSLVFRAYTTARSVDYNAPYEAENTVTFIGDGASGAMPRNRGKFDSTKAYCYNDEYRDFVWTTDGQVYMRTSKYATGEGLEHGYVKADVSDKTYWVIAERSALIAIDTALIDNANIAGFTFVRKWVDDSTGHTYGELRSENGTLILDAYNGKLTCLQADVRGSITAGEMSYNVLVGDGTNTPRDLTGYGMASGSGVYILPAITEGKTLQIRAICANYSRTVVPFGFKTADGSYIYTKADWSENFTQHQNVALDYNRLYTFTSAYDSFMDRWVWILSEGMGASDAGQSLMIIDSALSEDSINPVQNKVITNEFKKYVTLKGNKQIIEGDKDFTGQLMVNGKPLVYNSTHGYWKLDGDLLVTGGVAMHSSDTSFSPSTITQAVAVDGITIINDGKKLMLNPDIELGGGGVTSWLELKDKPNTIAGYDIRDAKIEGKTITLGSNSMTVYAADYAGTANQVLISGGEGSTPYWVNQGSITAGALTTKSKTAWGQTYWTSNGVPTDISGSISDTGNITPKSDSTYTVGTDGNGYKCFYAQGSSTDVGMIATGSVYKLGFIIGTGNSNRGIFDYTNNSWLMYRGDSNNIYFPQGHIGIGTLNPESKLHVNGSVQAENTFWLSTKDPGNGTLGFTQGGAMILRHNIHGGTLLSADNETIYLRPKGSTNGDCQCTISAAGNMLVSGGITMHSDERKKTILNHVELSLEEVANAPLIEYYYKSDEQKTTHVGSIAQYWAGLNDWFCKKDEDGFYAMEIQNAALASAISVARDFVRYKESMAEEIRLMKEEIENLKRK